MRLIITEKPSMGRDVAAALGATKRGDGFIEGKSDIVTWCIGHLVELNEPETYDPKYKSWRAEHLPIIPAEFTYRATERTRDQFSIIKQLLSRADVTSIVNAADAGREGELIFDLVYTLAGCRKPVERLWISSLTREAIIEGFRSLRPATEYSGLKDSARARQQADWLVGMNATRAQTIKARAVGHEGVYSLGRVQTPTLALIVGRDREIKEFVPVTYFEVHADFRTEAGEYRGVWTGTDGTRFDLREKAETIAAKVAGKRGAVEQVERKATKERPPLLHDLTSLQRAANARYGFSAAHTLELGQSLYEKRFITYPRTSSRHLSKTVAAEIKAHIEAASIGPYAAFVQTILAKGTPKLTSRHVDDKRVTDHHAIIPSKQRIEAGGLSADEKRVYDLLTRRFLAAFYPDAELERTTITTLVEGERFLTRGTVVLKAGWREVDPPGKTANAERADVKASEQETEEVELPRVARDDVAETLKAEAIEKKTKAPPRYTEASLLGAMETAGKKIEDEELRLAMKDSGLGTAATRAAVIETLLKREYVTREGKTLVATPKGATLIEILPSPILKSAELTGAWEQKLARMARGDYELNVFMNEAKVLAADLVKEIAAAVMSSEGGKRRQLARPDGALDCPKCKHEGRAGFLVERTGASGKFQVCSEGKEVCGYLTDAPKNAHQRKAMVQTPCPTCGGAMRLRLPKEKGKRAFLSCVKYPDCSGRRWFDEKSVLEEIASQASTDKAAPKCPLCSTQTVMRGPASSGNYFWACPRWRSDDTGCKAKPIWINEASA